MTSLTFIYCIRLRYQNLPVFTTYTCWTYHPSTILFRENLSKAKGFLTKEVHISRKVSPFCERRSFSTKWDSPIKGSFSSANGIFLQKEFIVKSTEGICYTVPRSSRRTILRQENYPATGELSCDRKTILRKENHPATGELFCERRTILRQENHPAKGEPSCGMNPSSAIVIRYYIIGTLQFIWTKGNRD